MGARKAKTVAEANKQLVVMPVRFESWLEFAHSLDGYAIAKELGYEDWCILYHQSREKHRQTGQWEGTALELRCILFFYARSLRFSWYHEDLKHFAFVDGLLMAIANRLGLPYQTDPDAQRRHQEKTEALKRMTPDERLADMGLHIDESDEDNDEEKPTPD